MTSGSESAIRRESPQSLGWLAAFLVCAVVVVYLPAFKAGFIWDDDILLTANAKLQTLHGLKEIWLGQGTHDYTPLTLTSFWLEKRVWGDAASGYHAINLLLHAVSAILLWRILTLLRIPGAWLAGLLFAIHPVNVASVAWIAERKNTLSGVLFFAAILAFLLASGRSRGPWLYIFSLVFFLLSGLSKGSVATMPPVLCGLLLWKNGKVGRQDMLRVAPFFLIAMLISLLTIRFQARAPDLGLVSASWPFRLARAGLAVWSYLRSLFFPIGLSPMVAPWTFNLRSPSAYLPGIVGLSLLAGFFHQRRGWGRSFFFGYGYFLLMLLPVLGLIRMALQQETPVADWWEYLAGPGIFALVAGGYGTALAKLAGNTRLALQGGLAVILLLLSVQTWRRAASYQSMESYSRAVLAEDPHAWTLQNNLGVVLRQKGQVLEAIAHYRQALADNPRDAEAHNNLGNALSGVGEPVAAKAEFLAALAMQPNNSQFLANLADSEFEAGEIRQALATEAAAIRADRYNPQLYRQFGLKLAANQQHEQAAWCFRNARALDPGDILTQIFLIQSLLGAGHIDEARAAWEDAWKAAQQSGSEEMKKTVAALRAQCEAAK